MTSPQVSVIIPAYKEDLHLRRLLEALKDESGIEVIVSIPRDDDVSKDAALNFSVKIVEGDPGRGAQLRAGAAKAAGGIFLFCHADTLLPGGWKDDVTEAMERPSVSAGAFDLSVDSPHLSHMVVAFLANIRARFLGLVYGDQAVFTKRGTYFDCGGFREMPLMEDVDFISRLKKKGKVILLKKAVVTSARRWQTEGAFYSVLRNSVLIILYLAGVPTANLARWYRRPSGRQ